MAEKINIREHQFSTGATRPRMTGMAIISFRLPFLKIMIYGNILKHNVCQHYYGVSSPISRLQPGGKMHPMIRAWQVEMEIRRRLP